MKICASYEIVIWLKDRYYLIPSMVIRLILSIIQVLSSDKVNHASITSRAIARNFNYHVHSNVCMIYYLFVAFLSGFSCIPAEYSSISGIVLSWTLVYFRNANQKHKS